MADIFQNIVNMSFSAGYLILAVLVIRLVLKRAPKRFICLLWGLVAIRLICPFTIESVTSLLPAAEPIPGDYAIMANPQIESGITFIDQSVNPIIKEAAEINTYESVNPLELWLGYAGIVWLIGLGLMMLYAVISYGNVYRRVRVSLPAGSGIYLCDEIETPFILGMVRPRIYMPSGMPDEICTHVIAHERAHLKRLDHWWKPLGYLLLAVYWFHPLLWVAYILLCRDIEMACDEQVVQDMHAEEKQAYSRALVQCNVSRRMIAACPLAFGETGVKARVKSVLNYHKPSFWMLLLIAVVLVGVVIFFMTNPVSEPQSEETGAQQQLSAEQSGEILDPPKESVSQPVTSAPEQETVTGQDDWKQLLADRYVDVESLATYQGKVVEQLEIQEQVERKEKRLLACEEAIQNELEYLTYNYYYFSTVGSENAYDKLEDMIGENESLLIAIRNEEKQLKEGRFMSEYRIHSLEVLPVETMQTISEASGKQIADAVSEYGLEQFAVVKADVSWKHNEASMAAGPQLDDGRYTRYFLMGSKEPAGSYKMYEIFWDDLGEPSAEEAPVEKASTVEQAMDRILSAMPLEDAIPVSSTVEFYVGEGDRLYLLDQTEDGTYSLYGCYSDEYLYSGLMINYKINGEDNWNYLPDIEHWIGYELPRLELTEEGDCYLTYCFGTGTGAHVDRLFYLKAHETGTLSCYELSEDILKEQVSQLVSFELDESKKEIKIFGQEGGNKVLLAQKSYEPALNGETYTIQDTVCDYAQIQYMPELNMVTVGYSFLVEESVMPLPVGKLTFRIDVKAAADGAKWTLSDVGTYETGGIKELQ